MGGMAEFDPAQPLVHALPDPEQVELRPDLVYAHADGHALGMDAYLPAQRAPGTPVSAVLLVHGEADPALLRGVRGWDTDASREVIGRVLAFLRGHLGT
jgi:hypothetical protein